MVFITLISFLMLPGFCAFSGQQLLIIWDMIIEIFCPICERRGIKKKLLEVDSGARGIIYPFCKRCHKNVRIPLVPECHVKRKA